jgi:hypothetical protein
MKGDSASAIIVWELARRPDLSLYLVHFARGEGESYRDKQANARRVLEEILTPDAKGRCTLRGNTQGLFVKAAKQDAKLDYLIQSASLTETPLEHLQLFCEHYSKYGIVFSREFIRRNGGNPVFYISTDYGDRLKKAAFDLIRVDGYCDRELTYLLPFFSIFGKDASGKTHDYYWEREWRVPQSLEFGHEDVLLGLVENQSDFDRFWRLAPDVPFVCTDWSLDWKMDYLKHRKSFRQLQFDEAREEELRNEEE